MKALHRLSNEAIKPSGETITLNKTEAREILNHVKGLESVAAALLKSQIKGGTVVLPYKRKP
jgi:hypothetical protein